MNRKFVVFVCLVLICSMVVPTVAVVAKKPPKPPADPPPASGTIFFTHQGWVCTVEGDGTEMTYETQIEEGVGRLSNIQHGGHYWYANFEPVDGTYPDGLERHEMFAVRDDNTKIIQLTFDGTVSYMHVSTRPAWGLNDVFVSWIAKKWVQGDSGWEIEEAGIYKQEVQYDDDGNVVGLADDPVKVWDLTLSKWPDGRYYPDSGGHSWSPDGTKFLNGHDGIYIVDPAAGTETYLSDGHDAEWSPDGSLITYDQDGNIMTIKVDGTDETLIKSMIEGRGRQPNTYHTAPSWSPDGEYIVYTTYQRWLKNGQVYSTSNICYIDLSTDKEYCLTDDLDESIWKKVKAWR